MSAVQSFLVLGGASMLAFAFAWYDTRGRH